MLTYIIGNMRQCFHGSTSRHSGHCGQGPIWLALTPEVARIYGYVRCYLIRADTKLLRMDDPEVVETMQKEWRVYCVMHPKLNKSAFTDAFHVSASGKVRRHSEFEGDAVVVEFLQWWAKGQWHGFETDRMFEDDNETTSHHAEIMLFDAADECVRMEDKHILPMDYDEQLLLLRRIRQPKKRRFIMRACPEVTTTLQF